MKRLQATTRRALLLAATLISGTILAGAAHAADVYRGGVRGPCHVQLDIVKGGFLVGIAGGQGTLYCGRRAYPIAIRGINAGLLIGGSRMTLDGTVENLRFVPDIEGTYSGGAAGIAFGGGVTTANVTNQKGVRLVLRGTQVGLEGSLNISGAEIRLAR
jgi:hypothetical protein